MSILIGIDGILNEGDNITPLMNCIKLINDCNATKEHNKACKLLVSILGKHLLDIRDTDLFDVSTYVNYNGMFKSESGRLKSTSKPVLVYTPPCGRRAAIIHIFNAINDFDNLKIEDPGFCCELGDRYFDVYQNTMAFDITDESVLTNLLGKYLKVFQW